MKIDLKASKNVEKPPKRHVKSIEKPSKSVKKEHLHMPVDSKEELFGIKEREVINCAGCQGIHEAFQVHELLFQALLLAVQLHADLLLELLRTYMP